jgi:phosphatidylserine decarboxylase
MMKFHREGRMTSVWALAVGVPLVAVAWMWWPPVAAVAVSVVVLAVWGLLANFFRMPHRGIGAPGDDAAVLCPSDGKVVVIEVVEEPEWFKDKRLQVSIFMSPLNVHAQWAPVPGKVLAARHHPGAYLVAWHPKSSTDNERTTHVIEGPRGPVLFRQVAGALARRICWYLEENQQISQGEEVGFIKFGSRVDVYLPLDAQVEVSIGQTVRGRETVLARLR